MKRRVRKRYYKSTMKFFFISFGLEIVAILLP